MTGATGVLVRPATLDDATPIANAWVASWQVAYRGQVPDAFLDGLSADLDRRVGIMKRILSQALETVFVSERDGVLTGFVTAGRSRDDDRDDRTGEIYAIYVHPGAWGTGTGRALFEQGEGALRQMGFAKGTLWVLDTNARARRFYEAMGWSADGATKDEERGTFTLHEVRYRREPL